MELVVASRFMNQFPEVLAAAEVVVAVGWHWAGTL
jgi:hypothetical protein